MRDINVCWVVWMVDFVGNKILGSLMYIGGVAGFFFKYKILKMLFPFLYFNLFKWWREGH
jgi:hypothetical protein